MNSSNEKRQTYYCSREWGLKKEAVHQRSGGVCERCHQNPGEAVHHKTYVRLYAEDLDDLWHLCSQCHDFVHGRAHFDPSLGVWEDITDPRSDPQPNQNCSPPPNTALTCSTLAAIADLGDSYNVRIDVHDFGLRFTMWKYFTGDDRITENISFHDLSENLSGDDPVHVTNTLLKLMNRNRKLQGGDCSTPDD